MAYTAGLCTLGCKVSQYETEAIGEALEAAGFSLRPFSDRNDVYVINTCTVTAESDRKSRQMIRRAIRKNPGAVVIVAGCYSQSSPEEVLRIGGIGAVIGNADKLSVPSLALRLLESGERGVNEVRPLSGASFEPMSITRAPRTRAYIKIEDGCDCRCSYCAIPAARGPVRSRPAEDIIREAELLSSKGTREIVLTGIETASWGRDTGEGRLIELLEELDRRGSCERIRLGSLTPEVMLGDFPERVSRLRSVARHFHLSLQSGSDRILAAMRRRYNTRMVREAVSRLRSLIPEVMFTADVMVGFPGEGEAEELETLRFAEEIRFLDMHVFAYSRRTGTEACSLPGQVPEPLKHERSARLIALKNSIRDEILAKIVNNNIQLSVIFETCENGIWTGHSDNFIEVRSRCGRDVHGEMLTVAPVSCSDGAVNGRIVFPDLEPRSGLSGSQQANT